MDLILRMLAFHPDNRIKLKEIRTHSWVNSSDRPDEKEI